MKILLQLVYGASSSNDLSSFSSDPSSSSSAPSSSSNHPYCRACGGGAFHVSSSRVCRQGPLVRSHRENGQGDHGGDGGDGDHVYHRDHHDRHAQHHRDESDHHRNGVASCPYSARQRRMLGRYCEQYCWIPCHPEIPCYNHSKQQPWQR